MFNEYFCMCSIIFVEFFAFLNYIRASNTLGKILPKSKCIIIDSTISRKRYRKRTEELINSDYIKEVIYFALYGGFNVISHVCVGGSQENIFIFCYEKLVFLVLLCI